MLKQVLFFLALCLLIVSSKKFHKKPLVKQPIGNVHKAHLSQFLFATSIRNKLFDTHLCTGTIVAKSWVLTAASCLVDEKNTSIVEKPQHLRVHANTLQKKGKFKPNADVSQVHIHHLFEIQTKPKPVYSNNVALLRLAFSLVWNIDYYVFSIIKPTPVTFAAQNKSMYLVGWPAGNKTILSYVRMKSVASIPGVCNTSENNICAAVQNDKRKPCVLDVGSGLVVSREKKAGYHLVGMEFEPNKNRCQGRKAEQFLRLEPYMNWIRSFEPSIVL